MKTLLVAFLFALASSQVSAMDSLSQFEWKNRVVLVFGDAEDPKLKQQLGMLERQKPELDERDMVVIRVSDSEARVVYGIAIPLSSSDLRNDTGISGDAFHLVLVGKDGGIKLRSEQVVGSVEMFDFIDRMPMRRSGRD